MLKDAPGSQPLGAGDQIRLDAENLLGRKPVPQTAKPRHDLIGDVQHVVLTADLQAALVVACGRDDHSSGGQHRLGDEGSDVLCAERLDRRFEVGDLFLQKCLRAHPFRAAAGVDIREKMHQLVRGVQPVLVTGLAAE